jgi:hypothetical protein
MGDSKRYRLDIATKRNIKDLIPKIFKLKAKKKVFDKEKVDDILVRVDDGVIYEVSIYLDTSINHYSHVQDISDDAELFDFELIINYYMLQTRI